MEVNTMNEVEYVADIISPEENINNLMRQLVIEAKKMGKDYKSQLIENILDIWEEIDEEYEEEDEEEPEYTAIIKHIKSRESSGFGLKSKYRIGAGPIIVGRSEDCDISIPDTYLSQMHFKITCVDGDWFIEDLKSKNGTFVNDIRVRKPALLKDGDIISFGDVQFEFHPEQ